MSKQIEIDLDLLVSDAPEVMANCYQALVWMEESGHGETLAAAQIRAALNLLTEAGVRDDGATYKTEAAYQSDPEEIVELLKRIEASEREDAEGLSISQKQVEARMAKVFDELGQQRNSKATA